MLRSMRWQKSEQFYWSDDEEDEPPPIIAGLVYTDGDVLQLDLFHRAHSLRNTNKNKLFPNILSNERMDVADDTPDLPSSTLSKKKVGKSAKNRKSSVANLFASFAGRRRHIEPVVASKIVDVDVGSPAWREVPQLHDWQTCPSFTNEAP